MKTKINRPRPARRLRGFRCEGWISRYACDMKFPQDEISLHAKPAHVPWFQNSRSIIKPTEHAKERQCCGFIKYQAGRHLQKHRAAFFAQRAGLLQEAF